jgi:hypothetical protein
MLQLVSLSSSSGCLQVVIAIPLGKTRPLVQLNRGPVRSKHLHTLPTSVLFRRVNSPLEAITAAVTGSPRDL